MTARARVGVLISGRGSNLQSLIDACAAGDFPAEIVYVVSNVPDVEGLRRAERARIPSRTIAHGGFASRECFDEAVAGALREFDVAVVCLAGFMRVLSAGFVETWRGRLINIHPSLLPAFKGVNVHRRVLESGVRISGCTAHFVVHELDSGPIIAQAAVPVLPQDNEEVLAERVLSAEHKLYPLALRLLSEDRVRLEGDRAIFDIPTDGESSLFSPPLR
ncbi:MAG TPA: phosphoribosylglycinamide formyltransferase [Rhizomicrobium sp.]|jgi:phosphoribosylglycinamide formyltransferase-1